MKSIIIGSLMIAGALLIQRAPVEAFQGLAVLAVLTMIGWAFARAWLLKLARRSTHTNSQHLTAKQKGYYAPVEAHSNALDVASNPWVYGGEHDPRSHAYAAKQYHQREAQARDLAYKRSVRRAERTRELEKWKVADE